MSEPERESDLDLRRRAEQLEAEEHRAEAIMLWLRRKLTEAETEFLNCRQKRREAYRKLYARKPPANEIEAIVRKTLDHLNHQMVAQDAKNLAERAKQARKWFGNKDRGHE